MRDFKRCGRITIKAGTSILTLPGGTFSKKKFEGLGTQILELMRGGKQVILVSSGAIGFGMEVCGFKQRPREMAVLQACAAIGQGKLMHAYEQFFSKAALHTGQILLTRDGLEDRSRFLKVRQTFEELLNRKILPIVNENDTVATEEIAFGDNDVLSVHVAHLVQADLLVILSDVDGFYLKDGSRVREVSSEDEIDHELVKHLRIKSNEKTVGGMKSKLEAAKVAMRLGLPLLIVNGHEERIVSRALEGEDVGTLFLPGQGGKSSRKKWIAFAAARCGILVVDDGAYRVLRGENRSLLASGIVKVTGPFDRKDVVEIANAQGKVFGRGIVRYSSRELAQIAGKKSESIKEILGYKYGDEIIHRNDLVVWG